MYIVSAWSTSDQAHIFQLACNFGTDPILVRYFVELLQFPVPIFIFSHVIFQTGESAIYYHFIHSCWQWNILFSVMSVFTIKFADSISGTSFQFHTKCIIESLL